jgi:hypothetical protein
MSRLLSKKQQSVAPMIMLKHETDMIIIKIWKNEPCDVDEDGTKYHRCLALGRCSHPDCDCYGENAFRVRVEDLPRFLNRHTFEYGYDHLKGQHNCEICNRVIMLEIETGGSTVCKRCSRNN